MSLWVTCNIIIHCGIVYLLKNLFIYYGKPKHNLYNRKLIADIAFMPRWCAYFHFHFHFIFCFLNFGFALFQFITSKPQSDTSLKLFTDNSDLKNPIKFSPIYTYSYRAQSPFICCRRRELQIFHAQIGMETHLIHFNFRPNQ